MKKILFLLLLIFPIYLTLSLYFLDKHYFLSPLVASAGLNIRSDGRGEGYFAAKRNGGRKHEGIDLFAPLGTQVLAVRSGRVIISRTITDSGKKTGSGNYIAILHSQGITSVYAHLTKVFVKLGDYVRQGDCIGTVGKTGNANYSNIDPHLHFEIRKGHIAQDPMEYLQ